MGLVSQKINKSSGEIELLLQPKSRKIQKKEKKREKKIQPAKLKTRKGGLGKNQGKPAKLKTRKGSLGKNKGIKINK